MQKDLVLQLCFSPWLDQAQNTVQLPLPLEKGQGWSQEVQGLPVPKQGCCKAYSSQAPGFVALQKGNKSLTVWWPRQDGNLMWAPKQSAWTTAALTPSMGLYHDKMSA